MFGVSSMAIVLNQIHYRNELSEEKYDTHDRIDRRAYVALPDGRMALVYPVITPDVSLPSLWRAAKEMLSLLP
jgi:hypothetical protein